MVKNDGSLTVEIHGSTVRMCLANDGQIQLFKGSWLIMFHGLLKMIKSWPIYTYSESMFNQYVVDG